MAREIVFTEVDPTVFLEHLRHLSEVMSELFLIALDQRTDTTTSDELKALATQAIAIVERHQLASDDAERQAIEALAEGRTSVDIRSMVVAEALRDFDQLGSIFERIDEHSRRIELLALPASPAVAELRRRMRRELARHLGD